MMKRFLIPSDLHERLHFVAGKRTALRGEKEIAVHEPRNGAILGRFLAADKQSIDDAVSHAHKAQREWANVPWRKRGDILTNAVILLRRHANKIAEWEVRDSGKLISEAKAEVELAADAFSFFDLTNLSKAEIRFGWEVYNCRGYSRRIPFGVVGGIGTWNHSIQTAAWKIVPAIVGGNAIVYKPSPLAPITSVILAEILRAAGVPDGVVNIVQGGAETGAAMCENRNIKKIFFTGSATAGKIIARECADANHFKPCSLDLGGQSACVVFDDANMTKAVQGAMTMAVHGTKLAKSCLIPGQVCSNASRVLVQYNVLEQFTDQIVQEAKKMRIGDPLNESTQVGPCISKQHREKVLQSIRNAVEEGGATLLTGGERITTIPGFEHGYFMSPCILSNVNPQMSVCREDIFGPLMLIIPFKDDEEALQMANGMEFGLAGGIFTKNSKRANEFAAQMSAGNVYINTYNNVHPNGAVGGFNQSGYGYKDEEEFIEDYTQMAAVYENIRPPKSSSSVGRC